MNETQTPDSSNSTPNTPAPEPRPSGTGSNTGIVYVLENPAMPGYIKLGRTETLTQRMQSLFDTSVPVPFTCYYAARVEDPARVERSLFEAFGDKRSHRAAAVVKLVEVEDVTNQGQIDTKPGDSPGRTSQLRDVGYTSWGDTRIRKRPGNHLQSRESKTCKS